MQGAIFAKVLQMSLVGSYSIGIVLAARVLLKRCGSVYAYYLWVLMFAGLCLPISVPGNYSLIPRQVAELSLEDVMAEELLTGDRAGQEEALEGPDGWQEPQVMLHRLSPKGISSGQLQQMAEASAEPGAAREETGGPKESRKGTEVQETRQFRPDWGTWLAGAEAVWFLGIVLLALCQLSALYRMSRRCSGYGRPKREDRDRIVEADGVPSPFLWGVFRPAIYLPSGLEESERAYILAHEKVHRSRGDHLVKLLILAVAVVHWFNPLVWTAYALCCRDMEISCDEAVLGNCENNIKKAYAESLLKYAAGQNRFILSPLGFGEPSVKSRIQNVLRFRKKSIWISAAAMLCAAGVAAGLLFRPAKEPEASENRIQEAEPLPEGEEPPEDAQEGLVVNNGGEIVCVAGEYYYMDGVPLYSDGEALYSSVQGDDGAWHVCRYETDGSGFRWLFDGRIVDSTEYGQVLYCMFPADSGSGESLGWYDTQTEQTGQFSGDGISYLGKYGGFLYTSRQEADGLQVGCIREIDRTERPHLMKEGIPAEEILAFYADKERNRLVFATGDSGGDMDSSKILCWSYELGSGALLSKELTGLPYFAMMDGYLYFQRYKSREDLTLELFRTDYDFTEEEQMGEGLKLLRADEETHTLLAEKKTDHPVYGPVNSLVRVLPDQKKDQKKEEMLLDMEAMLPAAGDAEPAIGNVCIDWEFQRGDSVAYSELNLFPELVYVTVSHLTGGSAGTDGSLEPAPEEVHLTVSGQGGIGIWFPDRLTPGWEDDSWYTEPMVGYPVGMEAEGWDLEHAVDVRERFQELPMEPDASERRNIYLLGETEYWTLYGKGDYRSMLLARNGRYTEINHPYMSNYQMCPELMEADLDHDGITELAIRFNLKHGTGCSIDSLLLADFKDNGAWVSQFLEEDFTEQLMERITWERTEHGLQAYVDREPAGDPVEDEEGGRSFQSVSAGQLVGFFFDEAEGKIRVRAELEFWDEDAPGTAEYNGCAVTADVVWDGYQFSLRNVGFSDTEPYPPE